MLHLWRVISEDLKSVEIIRCYKIRYPDRLNIYSFLQHTTYTNKNMVITKHYLWLVVPFVSIELSYCYISYYVETKRYLCYSYYIINGMTPRFKFVSKIYNYVLLIKFKQLRYLIHLTTCYVLTNRFHMKIM